MKTSQKTHSSLLFSVFLMLFSGQICHGQWGIIKDIQLNNETADNVEINITPPKASKTTKVFKVGDTIYSGSKITVPKGTKLVIESKFNNSRTIRGLIEKTYTVSESGEGQRIIGDNNDGSVLNQVSNEVNGGVTASSSGKTVSLKTSATEFLVATNGKTLTYDLISGKVVINRRVKVELKEDLVIDSTGKRHLFVNEPQKLTLNNPKFSYNSDDLLEKSLDTENEIETFFKKQLGEQKTTLLRAGPFSKSAFKSLNKKADSLALKEFEKAIANGEIPRDLFIQSSLLLSEAYLRIDQKDISTSWLDIAFYFAKIELQESQALYDHYLNNGEANAAKAFGSDLVIANEYYAWACTVKLKLTACLESADLNPRRWLKNAQDLTNTLDKL